MAKEKITLEQAKEKMFNSIENYGDSIMEQFYEIAQGVFENESNDIEDEYDIVAEDGSIYDSDTDADCWYDEMKEEFITEVYKHFMKGC